MGKYTRVVKIQEILPQGTFPSAFFRLFFFMYS